MSYEIILKKKGKKQILYSKFGARYGCSQNQQGDNKQEIDRSKINYIANLFFFKKVLKQISKHMKKLKTFILSAAVLGAPFVASAQAQPNTKCGTTIADQAIIIDQLVENRKNIKQADIDAFKNGRTVTYVPITPHNVGYQGDDYTPIGNIYDMICDLNNNYAGHNIQFYLYDTIRFVDDYHIWDNPQGGTSFNKMRNGNIYKQYNTVNMYITKSVNGPASSWYSPTGDYVVIRQNMMAPGKSATETHELGHYFTLPHTFYGWEGVDADATYGPGNAPTTINGWPVERVTRGSGSNCNSSADYFCDTPADYYSDRTAPPCNHTPSVKDPTGATLNPDERNIMSYFADACVDSFSNQQAAAVQADIVARSNSASNNRPNWTQWASTAPTTTATVTEVGMNHIFPADGAVFPLSGSTTNFDWSAAAGATFYIVEVYPATPTGVYSGAGPIWSKVVRNADAINIPNTVFTDLFIGFNWSRFAWKVRPLNDYSTCTDFTLYTFFEIGTPVGVQDVEARRIMSMEVNPNPVVGNSTTVVINSNEEIEGAIQLYSIQGQLLAEQPSQLLTTGQNRIEINLNTISAGTYMVVVQTERGALHQKLIIQR